jgi:dihydroorotase
MSNTITKKKPFDAHVHLRRGATLRAVTPISAAKFHAAIVMPNTDPPIDSLDAAIAYREEILGALPANTSFNPLMTLYLTKNLTQDEIARAAVGAEGTKVYGVKYYPYGATTNSQWGFRDILEAKDVLKEMERAGLPLLLHGEVHMDAHGEEIDPYDGEKLFMDDVMPRLLDAYPKLKVSLEHVSTAIAVEFMEKNGKAGQLVTTVTPHHLMYDRRHAFGGRTQESVGPNILFSGGYRALLSCKPLVKRREDRLAIREMVQKGLPFVSAGTDSAPHPESKKFASCVAFGAFNSPVAVEMYAQVFDEIGALDKLENFLSVNGPRFFGLEPSDETITLEKKDWQSTKPIVTEEGVNLWPVGDVTHGLGNETIHWRIKS